MEPSMEPVRYVEPDVPCYPDLRGKAMIVTGGGTNIGRGIALRLGAEGGRVLVCGRRVELLDQTRDLIRQAGGECEALRVDLTCDEDINRLFETVVSRFGTLDVLVQNAAYMFMTDSPSLTLEAWDRSFATIARGAFQLASHAYKLMEPKREGVMVFISTIGALRAHRHGLPYDSAKAAVDGLVRNLAVDYGDVGIRVNGVAPGPILPATVPTPCPEVPIGRNGTTADIAAAVAFMASRQASYITGQILYVDGGVTVQLWPRGTSL